MGDCDILRALLVVMLASCSTPSSSGSNLLPPAADADTPSRRPGDPPIGGAAGDAGPAAVDVAVADTGPAPAGAEAGAPATSDVGPPAGRDAPPAAPDAPPAGPDVRPSLTRDASELPPDLHSDVGVTWDANMLLTDCGITKPWGPKQSYPKYSFALNYGHIFQCLGEPPNQNLPSPGSDCKSLEYEPGKPGGPWAAAWYDSGICRP